MHPKQVFLLAVVLAALLAAPAAQSLTVIDFESNANLEVLGDQFIADLVTFDNLVVLESFSTLNEFNFPPSSGIHAAGGFAAGPAVIEFVQPAYLFSVHVTTADQALVQAFDKDGLLLDSTLIAMNTAVAGEPAGVEYLLDLGSNEISRVVIASSATGNAFALTIDDVAFAIPEPSALLVMAVGLLPVSAAIRRRARS